MSAVSWHIADFELSLSDVAPATVRAYVADLDAFAEWAGRGGIDDPSHVDRRALRRYLAYLDTRRYSRRTVARKASSLRSYFAWCERRGVIAADPAAGDADGARELMHRHIGHTTGWWAGRAEEG